MIEEVNCVTIDRRHYLVTFQKIVEEGSLKHKILGVRRCVYVTIKPRQIEYAVNPFDTDLLVRKFNRQLSVKKQKKLCIFHFLATH